MDIILLILFLILILSGLNEIRIVEELLSKDNVDFLNMLFLETNIAV